VDWGADSQKIKKKQLMANSQSRPSIWKNNPLTKMGVVFPTPFFDSRPQLLRVPEK
jgi:hypothetical protein